MDSEQFGNIIIYTFTAVVFALGCFCGYNIFYTQAYTKDVSNIMCTPNQSVTSFTHNNIDYVVCLDSEKEFRIIK